jgi:hypothetical protein
VLVESRGSRGLRMGSVGWCGKSALFALVVRCLETTEGI